MPDNGDNGGNGDGGGVLVTPGSLGTFAGANLVAGVLWTLVKETLSQDRIWALVIAAFISLALAAYAKPLPARLTGWRRPVIWLFVFVGNLAVIWAAQLGINEVGDATGVG